MQFSDVLLDHVHW